jgi:hypothetical protein
VSPGNGQARPADSARAALAGLIGVIALTSACAPSLSTMAPARVVPARHLQVTTSADITDTSGPIRDAFDGIEDIGGDRMTQAEVERAADAATSALIQPPAVGYQLSLSYGLFERVEIGMRTSMNTVRGFGRVQLFKFAPGFYGVLGLGVSGYLYGFPIQNFTDRAEVQSFSRWDVDVPLHVGFSNRYVHLWGGPKMILSTYDATVAACVDRTSGRCAQSATVTLDGTAAYLGGQLGIAVGYRQFWVAAELTVARVGAEADLAIDNGRTETTRTFDREGLVLSPSVGVIAWF